MVHYGMVLLGEFNTVGRLDVLFIMQERRAEKNKIGMNRVILGVI